MKKLRDVRLGRVRAFKGCTLNNLGAINVICGRNNSGKSTLLEAIATEETRFAGIPIGPAIVDPLFRATTGSMGWRGDGRRHEDQLYHRLLASAFTTEGLLFSGQEDEIVQTIAERYGQNPILGQWAFGSAAITNELKKLTTHRYKAVAVPPKRILESNAAVNTSSVVSPNGVGLVAYLFYAKNQPRSTPDRRLFEAIRSAFLEISSGYVFEIFLSREGHLELVFAQNNGAWVTAQNSGLGLHDLLVLLYFCKSPHFDLVCIEEPESHLHPEMQRRLLAFLKSLTDRQFFLSTHSSVFLDNAFVDRVFFTTFTSEVIVDDATSRASILDDLGYSVVDNLVSDLIVLVEGPSDTPVFEEFLIKMGALGKYDIKFWPLGGDIMDQVDLSVFAQRYSILAVVDKDPKSARIRRRFAEKCQAAGIPLHQLKKRAIENYFSLAALRSVFGSQIPATLTAIDPNAPLETQIGMNVKKNNRRIAREMQMQDIAGTDLHTFLEKVLSVCASPQRS